mmetsp:Transcript_37125/g.106940  ORF Transcript_37125/g.106940 Transcript_37125/m.106940 type:complete len:236 (+) Transcript_37125:248-955(+)
MLWLLRRLLQLLRLLRREPRPCEDTAPQGRRAPGRRRGRLDPRFVRGRRGRGGLPRRRQRPAHARLRPWARTLGARRPRRWRPSRREPKAGHRRRWARNGRRGERIAQVAFRGCGRSICRPDPDPPERLDACDFWRRCGRAAHKDEADRIRLVQTGETWRCSWSSPLDVAGEGQGEVRCMDGGAGHLAGGGNEALHRVSERAEALRPTPWSWATCHDLLLHSRRPSAALHLARLT